MQFMSDCIIEAFCSHFDGDFYLSKADWRNFNMIENFINSPVIDSTYLDGYGVMLFDIGGYAPENSYNAVATTILAHFKSALDDPIYGNVIILGTGGQGEYESISAGFKERITGMGFRVV